MIIAISQSKLLQRAVL